MDNFEWTNSTLSYKTIICGAICKKNHFILFKIVHNIHNSQIAFKNGSTGIQYSYTYIVRIKNHFTQMYLHQNT